MIAGRIGAGLAAAFGRYEAALALRVLGLEDYPRYRAGGRPSRRSSSALTAWKGW